MKISVTQEHIKKGRPNNCKECPVALALKEQTGQNVLVMNDSFVFEITGVYPPPIYFESTTIGWINGFDTGVRSEPFEFELEEDVYEED